MHLLPRIAYGLLTLSGLIGIITSVIIDWAGTPSFGGFLVGLVVTPLAQLRFFTFMSNLLVTICALQLVVLRDWTRGWHMLRIAGTVCIVITGIVFNLLLASDDLVGLAAFNNFFVHILTPILTPVVWLLFGPRQTTWRRILVAAIIPITWLVVTLVRGAVTHWYPYTILDVHLIGPAGVSAYVAAILVFFVAFTAGMWFVDRTLPTLPRQQSRPELPVAS